MQLTTQRLAFVEGEHRTVEALTTDVPGLVIVPLDEDGLSWQIIHTESGLLLSEFPLLSTALTAVAKLGEMLDFTKDAKTLKKNGRRWINETINRKSERVNREYKAVP